MAGQTLGECCITVLLWFTDLLRSARLYTRQLPCVLPLSFLTVWCGGGFCAQVTSASISFSLIVPSSAPVLTRTSLHVVSSAFALGLCRLLTSGYALSVWLYDIYVVHDLTSWRYTGNGHNSSLYIFETDLLSRWWFDWYLSELSLRWLRVASLWPTNAGVKLPDSHLPLPPMGLATPPLRLSFPYTWTLTFTYCHTHLSPYSSYLQIVPSLIYLVGVVTHLGGDFLTQDSCPLRLIFKSIHYLNVIL